MATVRLAVTVMGYVHNREEGRRAHGIMVTADAKTFDGGLCGVGANVRFDRIVEDKSKTDAFGDHPRMRVAKWMRPPMQPIASHALEVKSRKDGQMHPNCNRRAFARMMVASDMHRVFRDNRGKITASFDAATDNRGKGKFKETMANMCGTNSLMEAMIQEDMYMEAERDLRSAGLLGPLQQLYDRRDLPELINKIAARRAVQRRKDRKASALQKLVIDNLEEVAETASKAAEQAMGEAARLATQAEELKTPEACARKTEADMAAESAEEEAIKARRELKNARKRGKHIVPVPGPAGAGDPSHVNAAEPALDDTTADALCPEAAVNAPQE